MRILLADDQPELRSAVRFLLEQEADVNIVGEVADAVSAAAEAARLSLLGTEGNGAATTVHFVHPYQGTRPRVTLSWNITHGRRPPA